MVCAGERGIIKEREGESPACLIEKRENELLDHVRLGRER